MKKFVCSTILVFAVALIFVSCGSSDKREEGNAVAKSEEAKTEEEQIPQWVMDGGESASSDEEICAVGQSEAATKRMIGPAIQHAVSEAQLLLCQKAAIWNDCNLPKSKMKKMSQSRVDKFGRIPIYVLVCIDRKDLEENKERSEETTDQTDKTDKTDEDKVVQ